MEKWKTEDKKLLKTTDRVDYDVESFAKHLDTMLDNRIKYLTSLRGEFPTLLIRFVFDTLLNRFILYSCSEMKGLISCIISQAVVARDS